MADELLARMNGVSGVKPMKWIKDEHGSIPASILPPQHQCWLYESVVLEAKYCRLDEMKWSR